MSRKSSEQSFSTPADAFLGLTFGEVDALLAAANYVASEKRTAFQARLKNMLRVGLLEDSRVGRGVTKKYSSGEIFLLGVAVELMQFGMSPLPASRMVWFSRAEIARAFLKVIHEPQGPPVLFTFDPDALRPLMDVFSPGCLTVAGNVYSPAQVKERLESTEYGFRRLAVLDITKFTSSILANFTIFERPWSDERNGTAFLKSLGDWAAACLSDEKQRREAAEERIAERSRNGDDS